MAHTIKKAAVALAAAILTTGVSATATAAESGISVSANLGLVTDYKFRGVSQTDGGAAIQGGADLELENGFYLGTWASQVDFAWGGDETDYEQDFYGGYTGEFSTGVGYDLGYIYYAYHGSDRDEDYQEVYGSIAISNLTLGAAYSDDYWAGTGKFLYAYGEFGFELPAALSLDFHLGANLFEEEGFLFGADSYVDYSLTLSRAFGGLSLSASLVGTDISDRECYGLDWCEPSVLAGATYSW
ncbi:TorF family putative porin [Microbulbifer sp. TYP-18]|uniref:TorF family putative porin n=1 Tax=Microbulbifer sp. TYP-18 TaxID=3230024 RepID=UPI0034C62A1B